MSRNVPEDYDSDAVGKRGQRAIVGWLRGRGFSMHETGFWAPFDMYTERGTTIEAKVGFPYKIKKRLGWGFAISRHGHLCQENCVDFYVFRLEPGPQLLHLGLEQAMHLVFPATEVTGHKVWISLRTLITKYAGRIDRTEAISESDKTKTIHDFARVVVFAQRHSPHSAHRQRGRAPSENRISDAERQAAKDRLEAIDRATLLERIASGEKSPAEQEIDALKPKDAK
jgi:hypothetical protein